MRCRGKAITLNGFITKLELYHNIEFSIAKGEHRLYEHIKRWSPIIEFPECENADQPPQV